MNSTGDDLPFFEKLIFVGNSFDRSAFTNILATLKLEQEAVSGCSLTGNPYFHFYPIPFNSLSLQCVSVTCVYTHTYIPPPHFCCNKPSKPHYITLPLKLCVKIYWSFVCVCIYAHTQTYVCILLQRE